MKYAALSDVGLKREKNEDNWNIVLKKDGHPAGFIIADGMGGYVAGEEASRIAVEEMSSAVFECLLLKGDTDSIKELITKRIDKINAYIMDYSAKNLNGMKSGTTLSVGIVAEDHLYIAHVGDCRVYLIREKSILRLTEDHSYVAQLVKEGLISSDEAVHHPERNRITRALGFKDNFYPDFYMEPMLDGDIYVFCTDGLYENMTDDEILNIVLSAPGDKAVEGLVEMAKERGGTDNITVILAWM